MYDIFYCGWSAGGVAVDCAVLLSSGCCAMYVTVLVAVSCGAALATESSEVWSYMAVRWCDQCDITCRNVC